MNDHHLPGHLLLATMLRRPDMLYESSVLSILLYCSKTWTLLKANIDRLQAFHMHSVRRILGIRWYDHITNVEVRACPRLEDIDVLIRRRRMTLFGHVARMPPGVPAHNALRSAVEVRCGGVPDLTWTYHPGIDCIRVHSSFVIMR